MAHETHGFVAELRGVIDRGNARLSCVKGSRLAHGMHSDSGAESTGFFHSCGKLRGSVLVGRAQDAIRHSIRTSLVDFRKVGSLLVLLTHHFHNLLGRVRVVGVGENMLRGVVAVRIFVSAKDVDGIATHPQSGSGDQPLVDGGAN